MALNKTTMFLPSLYRIPLFVRNLSTNKNTSKIVNQEELDYFTFQSVLHANSITSGTYKYIKETLRQPKTKKADFEDYTYKGFLL